MTPRKKGLKTIANALFGGNNGSTFITSMSRSSVWPEKNLEADEPCVTMDSTTCCVQECSNGIDDIDSDSTSSTDSDSDIASALSEDQSFAYSLRNLCANKSKLDIICNEGGMKEIMALSKRLDIVDMRTRRYSMSIFFSLSQQPDIRHSFLVEGGTGAIVKLLSSTMSSKVKMKSKNNAAFIYNAANAILNLTLCSGEERRMLLEGAILATKLIMEHRESKKSTSLSIICSKILHNLTAALCTNGEKYVTKIVEAFPLDHQGIQGIAVRAFVNLSQQTNQRLILVETGVLLMLTRKLQEEQSPLTSAFIEGTSVTHYATVAIHNIACSRSCRTEMVNRGMVSALLHLVKCSPHPETIFILVSTLRKLTLFSDSLNKKRVIEDGGIEILDIALQHPDSSVHEDIARHAAKLVHDMASNTDCVQMMMHYALIDVLVELCCVDDTETRNSVASTFSCLTTVTACHLLLIESRAFPALFVIASSVKEERSMAIFDLAMSFLKISRVDVTRSDAVKAGILLPLVSFAQLRSACVLECCSEALHNLSMCSENVESMVCAGVLSALSSMLATGASPETDTHCVGCAAAIAHFDRDHANILSEKDLLPSMVKAVERSVCTSFTTGDIHIQFCSLVASLSFEDKARMVLRDLGALSIIAMISKTGTDPVRQRCATVLCNFSRNSIFHPEMIAADVVKLTSFLSNTYSEKTLKDCAACLCNLSASREICVIETLISHGAFSTILTILMVRSVCGSTRLMCAKVLANLTLERLKSAIEGGVIQAIEVLINRDCGRDKEAVMLTCAQLLRCLTHHAYGRRMLLRRRFSMSNLLRIIKSKNATTQMSAGLAMCALIQHEPEHTHSISKEIFPAMKFMSTSGNATSETACIVALVSLAASASGRHWCLHNRAASILVFLSQSSRKATILNSFGAMACMSHQTKLRPSLVEAGLLNALMSIILTGGQILDDIKIDCARILYRLTCSEELHELLIQKRVVIAIVALSKRCGVADSDDVVGQLMAHSLNTLACTKKIHIPLVDDGGAEVLVLLIRRSLLKFTPVDDISCVILDCVSALAQVSSSILTVGSLLASGIVETLSQLFPTLIASSRLSLRVSQALASLSKSAAHRKDLVDRGATIALVGLAHETQTLLVKYYCAEAFRHLSMENLTRASMISSGAEGALVELGASANDLATEMHCSAALMNLSAHVVHPKGIVQILLESKMKVHDGATDFNTIPIEEDVDGSVVTDKIIQDLLNSLDEATKRTLAKSMADCTSPHEFTLVPPKAHGGCACREIPPSPPATSKLPVWQPNQINISHCPTLNDENSPIILEFKKFEE